MISKNLLFLISKNRTTTTKVAKDLSMNSINIYRLIDGSTTDPRISTLKALADYFCVTVDFLISEESESFKPKLRLVNE